MRYCFLYVTTGDRMSTPVAERVRQFRERQRQTNPKEPLWRDLTGRLNVAAFWLGLGNAAPPYLRRCH